MQAAAVFNKSKSVVALAMDHVVALLYALNNSISSIDGPQVVIVHHRSCNVALSSNKLSRSHMSTDSEIDLDRDRLRHRYRSPHLFPGAIEEARGVGGF